MKKETLCLLEKVNQLALTEEEKDSVLSFFAERETEREEALSVPTDDVEPMVHVMPVMTVVREDVDKKLFSRDDLQKGAPETMDGYWQVPRLVE